MAGEHVLQGGVHDRGCAWQGACVVGRHAWCQGICGRGACMTGGMHGRGDMHGRVGICGRWEACMLQQILRDKVNEQAVHILLECILVMSQGLLGLFCLIETRDRIEIITRTALLFE